MSSPRDRSSSPLIAVTVPVRRRASAPTVGGLTETGYLKGTEIAGGIPLVVSPDQAKATTDELLALASGVVLTGGEDVDPRRYGGIEESAVHVSPERDEQESEVIEQALQRDLPMLAICRGMQLLNVVLGGTLYEDLASQRDGRLDHDRTGRDISRDVHEVRVDGVDLLDGVFRDGGFRCNSTHHQAIREPGEGLEPVGWSEDDLVEVVEYRGDRTEAWVAGVQWHPERMLDEPTGTNRRLFERFGRAVRENRERRG